MMRVTLLAVGKLKERYLCDGCQEYIKRLRPFCQFQLVELPEYRLPESPSSADIAVGLKKEGESILQKLPAGSVGIALCVEGRPLTSEQFAEAFARYAADGKSHLAFIIGGSHGLDGRVKAACGLRLSLSAMTFPHQIARMLVLEQVYRGFSILHNAKYHK